jgi:hypothetical protein
MPESSAWQELCRWEFGAVEEEEEDIEIETRDSNWRDELQLAVSIEKSVLVTSRFA